MCGVFGVRSWGERIDVDAVIRARDAMVARGPDDSGLHHTEAVALSHRRLSVLDLSELGRMPMVDESGKVWAVFNGEIYNHETLRQQLQAKGYRFRSHTDSECLVHGYAEWGDGLFDRLEGMFAIAIWDERDGRVTLARDPAGEKPLFYSLSEGKRLVFGSTLDAILAYPGDWSLDPEGVREYFSFGFVPAPRTVLANVGKVEAGTVVSFDANGRKSVRRFWSLEDEYRRSTPLTGASLDERVDQLDEILFQAVEQRMEADVPLGAFLSGGVDSSLVCAMMARARPSGVRAFTIGFTEPEFDESPYARRVAEHLGIETITRTIGSDDVLAEIPEVVRALDEPMADPSALPTLAVARLAREHLTVALTGDGADELFGGYRYYSAMRAFSYWSSVPWRVRKRVAAGHSLIPHPGVRRIVRRSAAMDAGEFFGRSGFYRGAVSGRSLGLLVGEGADPVRVVAEFVRQHSAQLSSVEAGMLWDATSTLPEAWLCKVDRAAMSVSLETRAPFLAPAVQRSAFGLPLSDKVRVRQRKVILKRLLERYVPRDLVERPKQGFTPPMGKWMRGVMRPEVEGLTSSDVLCAHVSRAGLARATREHLDGSHDHSQALWAALLLQRWMQLRGLA